MFSDESQKCPQCGCPITQRTTLVCPECGKMVTENDSKCTNCGCPSTLFKKANSDGQHANNNNALDNIVVKICPKCGGFEVDEDVSECSCCHTKSNLFKTNDFLRDYAETFPDKELLYQANSGDADAASKIGQCYEIANGVDENWVTAFVWYKKAAYMGSVEGMKSLAKLYASRLSYVPNAKEKALEWCEKAIKNGGKDVYSQVAEDLKYSQEYEKAKEWYKKGFENNESNAAAQIKYCAQASRQQTRQQKRDNKLRDNVYWLRFSVGWLTIWFFLILGASADMGDFAQKYAQKHRRNYSDVRDGFQSEMKIFPYPRTVFYFRGVYGNEEEIGSYAFWTYKIK